MQRRPALLTALALLTLAIVVAFLLWPSTDAPPDAGLSPTITSAPSAAPTALRPSTTETPTAPPPDGPPSDVASLTEGSFTNLGCKLPIFNDLNGRRFRYQFTTNQQRSAVMSAGEVVFTGKASAGAVVDGRLPVHKQQPSGQALVYIEGFDEAVLSWNTEGGESRCALTELVPAEGVRRLPLVDHNGDALDDLVVTLCGMPDVASASYLLLQDLPGDCSGASITREGAGPEPVASVVMNLSLDALTRASDGDPLTFSPTHVEVFTSDETADAWLVNRLAVAEDGLRIQYGPLHLGAAAFDGVTVITSVDGKPVTGRSADELLAIGERLAAGASYEAHLSE